MSIVGYYSVADFSINLSMTRSKNNADFHGLASTTCLDTDSIAWLMESPPFTP